MNIRYLEILEAVAQTGTFTGAAKKLYITQSAVSHAIAELEKQAGTSLFDRLPRGACLTRCGETLLEDAQHILAASRNLDKRIECLEVSTPVNIASSITVASFLLPKVLTELQKQMPKLQTRIRVASAAETMRALQKGTADIAFTEGTEPQGPYQTILLGSYRLYAVCAPDFPLSKPKLTPRELCTYPLLLREQGSAIRDTFDGMLSLANQKAAPVWESVNSSALQKAAEAGLGITVLPELLLADSLKEKRLHLVEIDGQPMKNKMLAVIHKEKYRTRPLENILKIIIAEKGLHSFEQIK